MLRLFFAEQCSSPTTNRPAAPELDRTLSRELKALSEIFGPFAFEGMQLVDRAVDHEMLVREQPVTLAEKLEREIEVTPTPQFSAGPDYRSAGHGIPAPGRRKHWAGLQARR